MIYITKLINFEIFTQQSEIHLTFKSEYIEYIFEGGIPICFLLRFLLSSRYTPA